MTSFASSVSVSTMRSAISTAPRELSTDDMINFDSKFIRKSRSKSQISRSNSVASLPQHHHRNQYPPGPSMRRQSLPVIQHLLLSLPLPMLPMLPLSQALSLSLSYNKQGSFYFPNGEVFTPRQTPKSRNRPTKIHHGYQKQLQQYQQPLQLQLLLLLLPHHPPQNQPYRYMVQSPSLPNIALSNQTQRVPPRRAPVMMRASTSYQNHPISYQQPMQPSRSFTQLSVPGEIVSEKRPSSASSIGSNSSRAQQISTPSSTHSLNQTSFSPSPSNIDESTPASSISYDDKLQSLTSELNNFERITEEPLIEEKLDPIEVLVVELQEEKIVQLTKVTEINVDSIQEVQEEPIIELKAAPTIVERRQSRQLQRAKSEKKSFMSKLKKLFGGDSSKKKPKKLEPLVKSDVKSIEIPARSPRRPTKLEYLPAVEAENFDINFDQELKDTSSILSFRKNDENFIQISQEPNITTAQETSYRSEPEEEDNNYMKFEDENFLRKIIEVGETTFPDLAQPELGVVRRKSMRLQKNLNRNSTISSQNSNSSMKTFRTSSSYLEGVERIAYNFQNSDITSDKIENLEIVRSSTLKEPKKIEASKSAFQPKDRLSTIVKRVTFSNKIFLDETFSPVDYDRFNIELKISYQSLAHDPLVIKEIRSEINDLKKTMEIHEYSRQYTHFFK